MSNDPQHEVEAIAATLCGGPIDAMQRITKGGNSRIYRVNSQGQTYALKFFPKPSAQDGRDRLAVERQALQFMQASGINCVPKIIAADEAQHALLLSWMDGAACDVMRDEDVSQCADFLVTLTHLSRSVEAQEAGLPLASEACISGARIMAHIDRRLPGLMAAAGQHPALQQFMNDHIMPAIHSAHDNADADADLNAALQVLIPSDFGAHNALRGPGGLQFLDFEYFGWDDSVTSVVNFLLHPAMQLSTRQCEMFYVCMLPAITDVDTDFTHRLSARLPLLTIRWCMIVLGEFVPSIWQHRVASGRYHANERDKVLTAQLAKAHHLINQSTAIRQLAA